MLPKYDAALSHSTRYLSHSRHELHRAEEKWRDKHLRQILFFHQHLIDDTPNQKEDQTIHRSESLSTLFSVSDTWHEIMIMGGYGKSWTSPTHSIGRQLAGLAAIVLFFP